MIDAQETTPAIISRVMVRIFPAQICHEQQLTPPQSKAKTDHVHRDGTAETIVDALRPHHGDHQASAAHHRPAQTVIATSNAAGIPQQMGLHHGDLMTDSRHAEQRTAKLQRVVE